MNLHHEQRYLSDNQLLPRVAMLITSSLFLEINTTQLMTIHSFINCYFAIQINWSKRLNYCSQKFKIQNRYTSNAYSSSRPGSGELLRLHAITLISFNSFQFSVLLHSSRLSTYISSIVNKLWFDYEKRNVLYNTC